MFFGLSPLEILVLLGLGMMLFGPDRLPQAVAGAAKFLKQIRAFGDAAKADLREQLGPEFHDLDLADLNPRTFVRKNLLGEGEQLRDLRAELNRDLREALDPGDRVPVARLSGAGLPEDRLPGARLPEDRLPGVRLPEARPLGANLPAALGAETSAAAQGESPRFDPDAT